MSLKKNLFVALVAAGAISMLADNSSAFFGLFRGGSHGSWGGGWGSQGSWGSCGSHGGHWGGWRGSHGSWGSYGSHGSHGSYGSHGGYYSAGYSDGGYYARRGVVRRFASQTPDRETVVAQQPAAAKTRLTLRVPAEAQVTLAGVTTKQTGEVRQFTTTKLASGQVWDDYKIVVALERNGQTLREERTIKLTGGQAQELAIDFDSQQLAQR